MQQINLDSLTDPRIDVFRNLKATNSTRRAGLFVAEGEKLFQRLLASDYPLHSVLLGRGELERFSSLLTDDLPVYVVPDEWIEQIVGFNFHRGVLACGRRKPNPSLDEICSAAAGRLTLVVCPDVQDPENLGAIFRISSAFGVDAVVLGEHCGDPLSRRVLRVSMDAVLRLQVVQSANLNNDLTILQQRHGVELWATVLEERGERLHQTQPAPRMAVLLGSEGHGLASHWIERCDRRVTIPMQPGTDSLNVSVAAGIVLYHLSQ